MLQGMLDKALIALLETPDGASAWKQVVRPEDVVGIKSNVWHSLRNSQVDQKSRSLNSPNGVSGHYLRFSSPRFQISSLLYPGSRQAGPYPHLMPDSL